jgi:hypothetical protein
MKDNLLKEQLAASGLEMQAAWLFPALSAATGLFGGIMGASEASERNRKAQDNYEKEKKLAKEIAEKTNEYNRKAFAIDKQNYDAQYNYQFETAIKSWERGNEIQDFQYLQSLRQYQRDIGIRDRQIDFNDLAANQAYAAEDNALAGLFKQQMFEREDQIAGLQKTLLEGQLNRQATQAEFDAVTQKGMLGELSIQQTLNQLTKETSFQKENALVKNLQQQGISDMRQAGVGRQRGKAMTMGEFYRGMSQLESQLSGRQRQAALQLTELGVDTSLSKKKLGLEMERTNLAMASAAQDTMFNMRVLDADIAGAIQQTEVNKKDIALRQYGADLNAVAQTMIQPQRLAYDPAPITPPKRIFIAPMEVIPGAVAAPVQQSVWGPIVSGIGSAASALGTIDWGGGSGGNGD